MIADRGGGSWEGGGETEDKEDWEGRGGAGTEAGGRDGYTVLHLSIVIIYCSIL